MFLGSSSSKDCRPCEKRCDAPIALAQRCEWEIGYQDEVWWSKVSQPNVRSWDKRDELLRLQELPADKNDLYPKALA